MSKPKPAPRPAPEVEELLTPYDVARMFVVDAKTVSRWAKAGKFPPGTIVTTLGGHRRFKAKAVRDLLNGSTR